MHFSTKFRSPLARRLIVAIILFSASITLFMTVLQLFQDYKRGRAGINAQFTQISDVHVRALAQSVWATNTKEIGIQLEGIRKLPNVAYVALHEGNKLSVASGEKLTQRVIERQFPLYYEYRGESRLIGQLTVVASLENLYQQLAQEALNVLLSNMFRTFLVALFIFGLFHRLITRHLGDISSHLRTIDPAIANPPLVLNRERPQQRDELDLLVSAANAMQGNIHQALSALRESEARVRLLLDSTTEAIYGADTEGICTFANPACIRMLGYSHEADLVGKPIHSLVHHTYPDGRPYPVENCAVRIATLEGKPCHQDDEVHWRADGTSFPFEYWSHPMYQDEVLIGSVVIFMDISARKAAAQQLLRFRAALDSSVDAIYIIDRERMRYIDANRAGWESLDYAREELMALGPHDSKPEFTRASLAQEYERILAQPPHHGVIKTLHRRRDGTSFPVEVFIQPLVSEHENNKDDQYIVAVARDVTSNKQAEDELHRLAYYDNLSGLPNRMLFNDRLRQAMVDAKRRGTYVAMMLMDLDRFKVVNDTMGHEAGDQLLREVAGRLKLGIREGDTVARLGGDEFALVFADIPDTKSVAHLAENTLMRLNAPIEINGREVFASGSLGIALYPSDSEEMDALMKFADSAMYHAKEGGRNNYQFYSQEMTASAQARLRLETDLRRALDREEFYLNYQPQVDVATGRITGVEALIRWKDAQGKFISPAEFIPLAEETGLIVPIGQWVLETAAKQLKVWHDAGYSDLTMAVNVATRQFRDTPFLQLVAQTIADSGIPAECLELEITEGVLLENSEQTRDLMNQLRAMKIQLAIDDFGTGYSSLSYLKRFPIDRVKIDQSFVRDISVDGDDLAIVRAIIALARALKLRVVAEGVETSEQLALLQAEGCDEYQGYFFARPMAANDIAQWLASSNTPKQTKRAGVYYA